jgi:phage tail tape-measure protein
MRRTSVTSDKSSERPGDERRLDDPNSENRDDHPVGTTTGTGAGATAGAVAGAAVGGPVGAVVGGVIGGVAGGAAGHGIADKANPDGDDVSGDKIPDPGTKDDRDDLDDRD